VWQSMYKNNKKTNQSTYSESDKVKKIKITVWQSMYKNNKKANQSTYRNALKFPVYCMNILNLMFIVISF